MTQMLDLGISPARALAAVCLFGPPAYLSVYFAYQKWFSPLRGIPGPFLAYFSRLWQVASSIRGHVETEQLMLHDKFGDFVRIGASEVSVGHPDAVRDVLKSQADKGDFYKIFNLPDKTYVNQMSETDAKRHIAKSKNVTGGYALSHIIKSEPYIDKLLMNMEQHLDRFSKEKAPVDFSHWFNWLAFDIVGELTFSRAFGFIETGTDVGGSVANTDALAFYMSTVGYYNWLHDYLLANPLIEMLNLRPSIHIFDTMMRAVETRQTNDEVRKDMMQEWLNMRRLHPERMEEKEILAAAVANIGAGAETISGGMQACIYYLIRNPKALAKLRDEIDNAELSPIPLFSEVKDLAYLQLVIKEALRMHPPVAFSLPRIVPEGGMTVGGRHFPAGVILSVNPKVIHQRKDLFGEDADIFSPERWMDPERSREMDKYFIAFGAGYNQCPGRFLANLELSKTVALLVRDYNIRQVTEGATWKWRTWVTSVPYGWPCLLTRRS